MKRLTLDTILPELMRSDGSDLHLKVGRRPIMRRWGILADMEDYPVVTREDIAGLVGSVLNEKRSQHLKEFKSVDFAHPIAGARFRVNIFQQQGSLAAVMRRIPEEIPSMEDIALPVACHKLVNLERGLVLVTGPTGSGKSTSLAAMLKRINEKQAKHILTLEHPIEFVHTDIKASVNQREVGVDTHAFKAGIVDAMRQDPDVILVGEMRDHETIKTAIDAAETGHLVFATLHTTSAPGTIHRIVGSFQGNEKEEIRSQLAGNLKAVISQTLLPRAEGTGRVAAHEVLLVTSGVSNSIRFDKMAQMRSEMQTGVDKGMQTLDRSLAQLVVDGLVDESVAREKAQEIGDFDSQLRQASSSPRASTSDSGVDDAGGGISMRGRR